MTIPRGNLLTGHKPTCLPQWGGYCLLHHIKPRVLTSSSGQYLLSLQLYSILLKTTTMKNLPIGIQNIQEIITDGYIYVDKTQFALELIQTGKHYFLSRPRRFGKSLFVSTLKEIFKGNKALFEGCHIAQSNYDWKPYPILSYLSTLVVLPTKLLRS